MFAGLAGAEIGGVFRFPHSAARDWKSLLETAMRDLEAHLNGTTVVLVWDELPLMLQKIARSADSENAMDLLDTLRGLRQTHPGIRMIFTGSIGLHHVVADLQAAGHMNDATNDMRLFEIPELSDADAADLARRLLQGEHLHADDTAATVEALVTQSNAIPFYIHHVVASMKTHGETASATLVRSIVADAMVNPQDAWHLQHFRDRLTGYYGDERLPVVLKLLDEVAATENAIGFNELVKRISGSMRPEQSAFTRRVVDGDAEALRALLELLLRDHYLQQAPGTGLYRFRFHLIRHWWCLRRGLAS